MIMLPWYEQDPMLLEAEKVAMAKCFPHFALDKLDDGRLYWIGSLTPDIYETKSHQRMTYTVMAVYNNNHPQQVMGSSIRIYPVLPDLEEILFRWNVGTSIIRPDTNPYGFSSQVLRDSRGWSFLGFWMRDTGKSRCSAINELRYFEVWLQLSECFFAMKLRDPLLEFSWAKLIAEFPSLNEYVRKHLYGIL